MDLIVCRINYHHYSTVTSAIKVTTSKPIGQDSSHFGGIDLQNNLALHKNHNMANRGKTQATNWKAIEPTDSSIQVPFS